MSLILTLLPPRLLLLLLFDTLESWLNTLGELAVWRMVYIWFATLSATWLSNCKCGMHEFLFFIILLTGFISNFLLLGMKSMPRGSISVILSAVGFKMVKLTFFTICDSSLWSAVFSSRSSTSNSRFSVAIFKLSLLVVSDSHRILS